MVLIPTFNIPLSLVSLLLTYENLSGSGEYNAAPDDDVSEDQLQGAKKSDSPVKYYQE